MMQQHIDEQLLPLVLGELAPGAAAPLEAHLNQCPRCLGEQRALTDALHLQALSLAPLAPPLALRERLLSQLPQEAPLLERLGQLFDLAVAEAQRIYDAIRDPGVWVAALPGVRLMHLTGGPATAGADCGLVHVRAGERFPWHRHRGLEVTLVLQGRFLDGDAVYQAGELIRCDGGSEHDMRALGEEDLIYAVTVFQGVEILEGDIQVTG